MAALEYAAIFSNVLRELYGQELTCDDLYHSNSDIKIVNGKHIKIPKLSVKRHKLYLNSTVIHTVKFTQRRKE